MEEKKETDNEIPFCLTCDDHGWVCENHPRTPWDGSNECCGGAGMPCQCNSLNKELRTNGLN